MRCTGFAARARSPRCCRPLRRRTRSPRSTRTGAAWRSAATTRSPTSPTASPSRERANSPPSGGARFASAAHRDAFVADPERYAPQYGGYCAWAVAHGKTAGVDPQAWKIVGGKLYLNYSKDIQRQWEEDVPGYVEKADANWPKLLGGK
jgi:hypothetical protein